MSKQDQTTSEIRIPVGLYNKHLMYWIWNKHLTFGEETSNEDLWNKGYEFGLKNIFGFKFIEARYR